MRRKTKIEIEAKMCCCFSTLFQYLKCIHKHTLMRMYLPPHIYVFSYILTCIFSLFGFTGHSDLLEELLLLIIYCFLYAFCKSNININFARQTNKKERQKKNQQIQKLVSLDIFFVFYLFIYYLIAFILSFL